MDHIRLSDKEIEALAREAIGRHFAGSSVLRSPLRVITETWDEDPTVVEVWIENGLPSDPVDPRSTIAAGADLSLLAAAKGESRNIILLQKFKERSGLAA